MDSATKFIPVWVKVAVAIALGLGTMVGWKRIVVTVGEKIGKSHLTYGQGASAELVAAATIGAADMFGLPVSTTHVLSSGVAGTMAGQRLGAAVEHGAQHGAGLGADAAGRHAAGGVAVLAAAAVDLTAARVPGARPGSASRLLEGSSNALRAKRYLLSPWPTVVLPWPPC